MVRIRQQNRRQLRTELVTFKVHRVSLVAALLLTNVGNCGAGGQQWQAEGRMEASPANYVLGPGDQLALTVANLEEVSNKPMRVDMRGDINLPVAGRIHVGGLTTDQVESAITNSLKRVLKDPEVVVAISEFRSQPVSILGAVNSPGVHQLEGHKNLIEVLSAAGGLRPDAGSTLTITRNLKWGAIPLPSAKNDSTGQYSIASVSSRSIMNGQNPAENIPVKPDDVISVAKADLVYVIGAVKKPGGFVLGQDESISALQVLALAEGLDRTAASDKAKIMRATPGTTSRAEIPVNLKKLMAGKTADLALQHDDILFVPNSAAKSALIRGSEAVISIGTGLAIYARP